ncbi:SH3 domain-containing protein [Amycolatopsis nigrescens]|uniref:SH3 domain-containing protein n=1 Tax=Amycolatopsis nigrescens TaxID=381445 RepID=UPI000380437C|nr:SH3 domain-containing protein [Amycolatopsis nigrescens]
MLGIPKRVLIIIAVLGGVLIVYAMGSDQQPSEGATGGSPTGCRVTVSADVLNVRSEPNANAGIVGKFQQNAETDAQPEVQNGFRKLAEGKWAASEFLKPTSGSNCG